MMGWTLSRSVLAQLSAAVFVACLGGCDESESENGGIQGAEDPLLEIKRTYSSTWCDCYWDGNYDSRVQCGERHPGMETQLCQKRVLKEESGAAERLECLLQVANEESACLTQQGCGDEDTVVEMCRDAAEQSTAQCPAYPDDVQTQLDDCMVPEPFWMVADDGIVFGIDSLGQGTAEPQETSADLNAIVCDGAARAWIAGDGGVVLSTVDAGEHWSVRQTPAVSNLRAVTQHHGQHVLAVGDAGAAVMSVNGGASWSTVDAPNRDFTAVAATADGTWLVADRGGVVWSLDDRHTFEPVAQHPVAVLGLAADHDSPHAAAVGERGLLLRSADSGRTWNVIDSGTEATLRTVNVVGPGKILAAGDQGVLVRTEGNETTTSIASDFGRTIHAMHVTSSGRGAAVGEAGLFLQTWDGGLHWSSVDLGIRATLRGLDQPFHAH